MVIADASLQEFIDRLSWRLLELRP
jgi:hypothetical protein